MSKVHTVAPGEHLAGIAAREGFSSFKALWNHPENAELKKLRKSPHVLFAGDQLFIPDREAKEESAAAAARHRFVASRDKLVLRVKSLDAVDEPRPPPCMLTTDGSQTSMTDAGSGVLEAPIGVTAGNAEMFFPNLDKDEAEVKVPVAIGSLDPVTEVAGQRQRLNNLGYFAGFDARSSAQLEWAIEEFQCDHLAQTGKKKEDGVCDAKTQQALVDVHGS